MAINGIAIIYKRYSRACQNGLWLVGFLIRNEICTLFDIKVLDNLFEGILWLKMKHKLNGFCMLPCVCYLPLEHWCRQAESECILRPIVDQFV